MFDEEEIDDFSIGSVDDWKAAQGIEVEPGNSVRDPFTDLDDIENGLGDNQDQDPEFSQNPVNKKPAGSSYKPVASSLDALAKDMRDLGIPLDIKDEDKLTDSSEFLTKMKEAIDKIAENKVQEKFKDFSGAKKVFLEIEGGMDDEVQAMRLAQTSEFLNSITEEKVAADENIAKNLSLRYYMMKGMSKPEADEQIELLQTQNKLTEKAKTFLPVLKTQTDQYIANARAKAQAAMDPNNDPFLTKVSGLLSDDKALPLNIPKEVREAAIKSMKTAVKVNDRGDALNSVAMKQYQNSEGFEALIQVYDQLGLFDMKEDGTFSPNLKKLNKLVKEGVTRNIDRTISKGQRLENSTNGFSGEESADGLHNSLSLFAKMAKGMRTVELED